MMYNPYNWKITQKEKNEKKCIFEQICEVCNEIDLIKVNKDKKKDEFDKILEEYDYKIFRLEKKKMDLLKKFSR